MMLLEVNYFCRRSQHLADYFLESDGHEKMADVAKAVGQQRNFLGGGHILIR